MIKYKTESGWVEIPTIKGDKGDPGEPGIYMGDKAPINNDINVWIDTSENIETENFIYTPNKAEKNQFLMVSAIDDNNFPIEWKTSNIITKTDEMTNPVGVDALGGLWSAGFANHKLVYELVLEEQVDTVSFTLSAEAQNILTKGNGIFFFLDLKCADTITTEDKNSGAVTIIPGYANTPIVLENASTTGNISNNRWAKSGAHVDFSGKLVDSHGTVLTRKYVRQQYAAVQISMPNAWTLVHPHFEFKINPAYPIGKGSIIRIYAMNVPSS
jgi:hypothetical protein